MKLGCLSEFSVINVSDHVEISSILENSSGLLCTAPFQ